MRNVQKVKDKGHFYSQKMVKNKLLMDYDLNYRFNKVKKLKYMICKTFSTFLKGNIQCLINVMKNKSSTTVKESLGCDPSSNEYFKNL